MEVEQLCMPFEYHPRSLMQVAETRNDMEQYWQLWDKGEWWWHINRSNITFGGHHRSRCLE
jgi:hypothetical protein